MSATTGDSDVGDAPARGARSGRLRRTAAVVAVVVGLALLGWLAVTVRWLVWPRSDVVADADVVVVLAGGWGERAEAGAELVARGAAGALVVSDGYRPTWPPESTVNRLCLEPQAVEVICPYPHPYSTAGEAQVTRRLAARRGWRSAVVVTSDFHVHRTRTLFERCFPGEVAVVAATPDTGLLARAVATLREVPLVARDELLGPGCPS